LSLLINYEDCDFAVVDVIIHKEWLLGYEAGVEKMRTALQHISCVCVCVRVHVRVFLGCAGH